MAYSSAVIALQVSGKRIREARLSAGLSQIQLARAIETGERNISRWETGSHAPRADRLAAIAQATGRDMEFFYAELEEDAPAGEPFPGSGRGVAGDVGAGRRGRVGKARGVKAA